MPERCPAYIVPANVQCYRQEGHDGAHDFKMTTSTEPTDSMDVDDFLDDVLGR